MPVVPTYGPRQVLTAALPAARKTAAKTELSAGVGVAQAQANLALEQGEAGQKVGAAMAHLGAAGVGLGMELGAEGIRTRQLEAEHADDVALLHAQRQLAEWESKRLYDPESGALTKRGTDSFPVPEIVAEEYGQVVDGIAAGLTTDAQRAAFAKIASNRGINLDMTLRRHVYGEMQRYEGEELQATVTNARNAAIANATDPRRVGEELGSAIAAIKTHGPRLGLGPEQVQQQIDAVRTETHVGVIDSLLAQDLTKSAEIYFEETKDQITGVAQARVEKALAEGKVRKQAQDQADAIIDAGGSLTQQRDKARAIDDPEVRDAVMQRLEHEDAVRDKAQRDADELTLRGVYDIVDRTKDIARIPPATWANLDGSQRSALRSYANALARGTPIETDLATYYGLMRKAGDDPEAFVKENLLNYRATIGETEFKQLANLQLALRQGDTKKAAAELSGFQTKSEILDGTLNSYRINPNPKAGSKEAGAIGQLRRMLDLRVQGQEALTGKKPTNVDMQHMLDELLSAKVSTPGSWAHTWANIWPGGLPFYQKEKRLIDATIDDVPSTDRTQIEQALRAKGRPVSDATILDLWLEAKVRAPR